MLNKLSLKPYNNDSLDNPYKKKWNKIFFKKKKTLKELLQDLALPEGRIKMNTHITLNTDSR